jgi:hypothetical protein
VFKPNPGQPPGLVWDAAATVPTNDWHLVSLFNRWFSTNDLRTLTSPNRATTASFEAMLDGMIVFTNNADGELVMSSNSPQAAIIAQGIIAERLLQSAQVYSDVGDILSVPELSIASLWLAPNGNKITDEAIEILPSQLLPLLRADSIGVLAEPNGVAQVQFSGFDEYAYAMQESSNLVDWVSVATNIPTHGLISYPTSPPPAAPVRYFRSLLLP